MLPKLRQRANHNGLNSSNGINALHSHIETIVRDTSVSADEDKWHINAFGAQMKMPV